jgi:hypothetical protein
VNDRKTCTHCGKEKRIDCFQWQTTRYSSWCKQCKMRQWAEHRQTEAGKAWLKAYRRLPRTKLVRLRYREKYRARTNRRIALWRQTPRGKLIRARIDTRYRLKRATTSAQRGYLRRRLWAINRELMRLEMVQRREGA